MYSSIEFPHEQMNSSYFVNKINDMLETTTTRSLIRVANSKIFPTISRESMKEFLKLNKRNKIMQLNELIEKMFIEAKYDEIIDSLEDFADSQKLVSLDFNSFFFSKSGLFI